MFQAMVAPVTSCGKPRLFFAGEHTCAAFKGFLHGAYLSGLDAATDILSAMVLKPAALPIGWTCRSVEEGYAWRGKRHSTMTSSEAGVIV
mmetsp:Transcript_60107/g.94781  ORF Transcript_60107/g.94781 Transcript_60107/m.94781 type:complete len:90 (+) Transcript_60107:3-272(+)